MQRTNFPLGINKSVYSYSYSSTPKQVIFRHGDSSWREAQNDRPGRAFVLIACVGGDKQWSSGLQSLHVNHCVSFFSFPMKRGVGRIFSSVDHSGQCRDDKNKLKPVYLFKKLSETVKLNSSQKRLFRQEQQTLAPLEHP